MVDCWWPISKTNGLDERNAGTGASATAQRGVRLDASRARGISPSEVEAFYRSSS